MQLNGAFIHLVLNHWPVLLPVMGVAVATVGLFAKLRQTQMVGLVIIVLAALAVVPTYFSGAAAKNVVQNYPGITTQSIEKHEDAALYSFIAIEIVGVLSLWLLWQSRNGQVLIRSSVWALIALTLVAFFLIARTAHLGGLIRHEEIEQGSF
jgi:uncharacterized membrane protein